MTSGSLAQALAGVVAHIQSDAHERPLFKYLALESSPAHPDDRLITIEIGRSLSGETLVNFEPLIWRPDTAIRVVRAVTASPTAFNTSASMRSPSGNGRETISGSII
ncbi:hypothetical protein [Methylobacterium sp. 174MFSha1.1]|uniref:hypothetical protein n=1 Tax=Methylobacterium sp. 174MFSha1.1 TaxID=1502749 RepID=UPI001160D46E|nr:hypothetical protein [Methylobacterium sp. 174MFSha1.1]